VQDCRLVTADVDVGIYPVGFVLVLEFALVLEAEFNVGVANG